MSKVKSVLVVKAVGTTPAEQIRAAVAKGANLADLKAVLEIQKEYDAIVAKKAFVKAMTAFKAEAPKVTKDKKNSQYNSKYTSLSNLVNTVNPVLSKHGLSASWDIAQNGIIKVSCSITHELGHRETASASAPADVSGAKNAIQQIKSTITYLKAVTFESICGLASSDANLDDDGNAGPVEYISDKEVSQLVDCITTLKKTEKSFCALMKIPALAKMPKDKYDLAMRTIKLEAERLGVKL